MSQSAKVLIVDDHPIVRNGLAALISEQPGLIVCGEAANCAEALRGVTSLAPDLLIVDISLKGESGLDLIPQVKALDSRIKILICSMHEDVYFAERVLRAGALGYVNKQEATEKLLEAIRIVLEGKVYVSSRITERLVRQAVGSSQPGTSDDPVERLSNRELEVLGLLGTGLTTSEVAVRLHLSPKTVETHRENLKAKLNLRNSAELMRWAVQWILERK